METLVLLLTKYGYFILFPLAAFEGPIISLVVGFLIYLGYLQFLPSYAVLLLGDIIPDTIYYYIGRFGSERKIMEKYGPRLNIIKKLWHEHGKKTMFFSKLAYTLSVPFLISAGLVKMPYRKFILYALPVTIFQYGIIMTIGYYLGSSYQLAVKYIDFAGIIIAIVFIIFIAAYTLFIKYARKQIKIMEEQEQQEQL
ncbi:MAG: hypothetical protein Q7S78_00905 [Candidatus Azambacteria bacterium]|nr:hypothetical protein [Candidatus Azambacteria bacterium]